MVQQGRSSEGTSLLDEAMAASLAGECRRPHTVVYTCCTLIGACADVADVDRVLQWVRAATVFINRFHSDHLHLHCRVYYGAVLIEAGRWADAERELLAAIVAGRTAEPALHAEACARLAELRLAQGRLEEAEQLLQGLHDFTTSAGVLAAIAASRGDTSSAARIARRRLRELTDADRSRDGAYRVGSAIWAEAAALWELMATVSSGPDTEHAVTQLAGIAERTGCVPLRARTERAAGIVHGDAAGLERALSLFTRSRMPLQAARTRIALSRLLNGNDAIAEARSALAAFEELGAASDADEAAATLRGLGVTAVRGGPADVGELTQREREVLDLLGEGLSNSELAARLFLSRKTIEHHVRTVLFKLGLRNRAEAAAYVVRHRQSHSSD
jgi:DNA-binding CsgD family transcriptional regulator